VLIAVNPSYLRTPPNDAHMVDEKVKAVVVTWKFYISTHGETKEDARLIPNYSYSDPKQAAVKAAERFHQCENGWECHWPIDVVVVDESGNEHRFTVEREMVPEFYVA